MVPSHRKFGDLLTEGIKRVHVVQKKPIGVILDEFGYALRDDGNKGRYALGHWYYKKRIPAEMADVEKLARLIVLNSDVERNWLLAFLESAGHPEAQKVCGQYFLAEPEEAVMPLRIAEISISPAVEAEPLSKPLPGNGSISPARRALPRWGGWLAAVTAIVLAGLALGWGWQVSQAAKPTAAAQFAPSATADLAAETVTPTATHPPLPTPSLTMAPATSSPLPAFSPTPSVDAADFDGRCPKANGEAVFVYAGPGSVIEFLDAGGASERLSADLASQASQTPALRNTAAARGDLTGDGVDEVVISLPAEAVWQVLGCNAGAYGVVSEEPGVFELVAVTDLNADRKAEVVRSRAETQGDVTASTFAVLVWDGKGMVDLLDLPALGRVALGLSSESGSWGAAIPNATAVISDTHQDGLPELLIRGGLWQEPPTCETVHERQFTDTWVWDGKAFTLSERAFTPPVYRFQAAANGDVAFAFRQYDRALDLYQMVIFNADLHPRNWFPPQLEYCARLQTDMAAKDYDPTIEALQLEAYGRWRLLLIHAVQKHADAMKIVYESLLKRFAPGATGYAYTAIAQAFWQEYQISQDPALGCEKARQAAAEQTLYPAHTPDSICPVH